MRGFLGNCCRWDTNFGKAYLWAVQSFYGIKFLDSYKIAKLKLLLKKWSKMDPSSYRPISLLPLLSEVFGRTVLGQKSGLFSRSKIVYDYQFGFRKYLSMAKFEKALAMV